MSISSGDINMLLKTPPTSSTSSTMLGGSRLMSNFKSTGYVNKFKGGADDAAGQQQTTTNQQATTANQQATAAEQQTITNQQATTENQQQTTTNQQQTTTEKKNGFMDKIKKSWSNFIAWLKRFFAIGKNKQTTEQQATPVGQTQKQTGGGFIGDMGLIIIKYILIFLIAICIIIIIEEIVNILKKVDFNKMFKGLPLPECSKKSCKSSKKSKKDKGKRQLIIAPVPCSEYVNSIGNKIKKQNQIIQDEPKMQAAEQETKPETRQEIAEQNLLQEASMINPINSALRDDDLFKDRLELQGVRNIPVNTRDFL